MLEFGEPVGYTFQAENYPPDSILEALIAAQDGEAHIRIIVELATLPVEVALQRIAARFGIEYDDERSYDSDFFPKPLFLEQLQCGDREWTELAPDHQWEPISLPKKDQTCRWCGKEREV